MISTHSLDHFIFTIVFKELVCFLDIQTSPTSLALDCLVREPDDLDIIIKTLRAVEVKTVTTVSMRYCPALRTEAGLQMIIDLCGETWEIPAPKGVLSFGTDVGMIETMYLRCVAFSLCFIKPKSWRFFVLARV
jgi:hypothetical protein